MNVPSLWELRQADKDRSAGGSTGSPPAVTGSIADGTALTNLLAVLAGLGIIDDQTVQ